MREAMCICYGGVDSYDFHGLETIQCMVERRRGGETGVKWVQAYRGDNFWKAHQEGVWPRDLFDAALCRSHTLKPAREGFNDIFPTVDDMRRLVKSPVAYRYEHADGLMSTMILLTGLMEDFNFAARIEGRAEPFSTQMYLPMPPGRTTLANFFSPLVNHAEKMFLTGKPSYPVERTLLTTGLTAAGVESLYRAEKRYETPHLGIRYAGAQGIDLLENLDEARRHCDHHLSIPVARAAHGRPAAGGLPARRQVGAARRESGLALRGPEARGRPEPGARAGVRIPGLSDDCRGPALRRR